MLTTPEDIDALLAAEKRLAGRSAWSKSRETTVRISVPLQIGDAIVGGLFLAGTASVHNAPQDGSLVLQYQGQVIERMNVFPTAPHANPLDKRLSPRAARPNPPGVPAPLSFLGAQPSLAATDR